MKLTILIPILNEIEILESSLSRLKSVISQVEFPIDIVVFDSGSDDGSQELAGQICSQQAWTYKSERVSPPSIGKAISLAIKYCKGEKIMVLPIDCEISRGHLIELSQTQFECGGFPKKYSPTNLLLRFYATAQNQIRSRYLKNIVWTNGIFANKTIWQGPGALKNDGLMEDVFFSDYLKENKFSFGLLKTPVVVSARLYYQKTPLLRVLINGLIMLLFRTKLVTNAKTLKKIYRLFQ